MRDYNQRRATRPVADADRIDSRRWVENGRWFASVLLTAVGLCVVSSFALVLVFSFLPVPVTPLVLIRVVDSWRADQPVRVRKDWVPLEKIAPSVMRAAIASEDFRFAEHNGFDFDAIRKAMQANERNERRGRPAIRGGSTISQQTAKNVFLWPDRSWFRKGLEAWFTILIEALWSKARIMEVYLNVIEFGDGVYGIEAAAQTYLKKSASQLRPSEAALLISVLPNPHRLRIDRPSPYVRFRQSAILRRLAIVEF